MVNLDQFYTKDEIAKECYNKVKEFFDINEYDIILEPSGGKGSFYKLFPIDKRIGLDLEPKYDGIIKQNFFDYKYEKNKKYITIGNPPFGKNCSIAIKFFNYTAQFSEIICFIIPRTFKRISVQNQLDLNFHLVDTFDLPVGSCFDPNMAVKCCFQIWKKISEKRNIIVYDKTHPDFQFIKLGKKDEKNQPTVPKEADFAIKAYGSNCGEIFSDNLQNLRPKSYNWIKSNININILKSNFLQLDYSISKDSARQDSLGHGDLVHLYKQKFNK